MNTRSRLLWCESFNTVSWELDQLGSIIETHKQGQIFNTESDAPELKDGSGTSSGGMKVVLKASFAYHTAVVLTNRLFNSTLGKQEENQKNGRRRRRETA